MKITYGQMLEGRGSLIAVLQLDFAPDVSLKVSRLGRVAKQHFDDYDKVRSKLEDMHAMKDAAGNMIPVQRLIERDGVVTPQDVPDAFKLNDADAWVSDSARLNGAVVEFDDALILTESDMLSVRTGDEEPTLCPWIVAGLGPFYDWGDEPVDGSAAEEVWAALQE